MLQSFAGGQLFGAASGSAPASVLALHGWRRTHRDFDPVAAAALAAGDDPALLAVDQAGFGATPAPPTAWTSADYAASLVPLFDEPGVLADRVVVLGHSFGGRVAVRLARQVPDRIGHLVLTGVPLLERAGRRGRPAVRYRVGRRLHRMGVVSDDRMEALRQRYGSPDYRAAQGVMRDLFVQLLAERYDEDAAAVTCPVTLVWGADDAEVPLEVAQRARALFPAATLEVLPGVGHLTPTEAPADLWRAVVAARPARPAS